MVEPNQLAWLWKLQPLQSGGKALSVDISSVVAPAHPRGGKLLTLISEAVAVASSKVLQQLDVFENAVLAK